LSIDQSLQQFLHQIVIPRLKGSGVILEVGCGAFPVFSTLESSLNYERHTLDLVDQASHEGINFHCANVLDLALDIPKKLNCWFDAHLFHTLVSSIDRERYFAQVSRFLEPGGGIFALEMALASKNTPVWKNLYLRDDEPFRFCPTALEMEQTLLDQGFQIEYFRIDSGARFIFDTNRDVIMDADPIRLRALCSIPAPVQAKKSPV
jgi:SAM-dependent methyltransferase